MKRINFKNPLVIYFTALFGLAESEHDSSAHITLIKLGGIAMKTTVLISAALSLIIFLSGCAVSDNSPIEANLLVVARDTENDAMAIKKLSVADNMLTLSPSPVLTLTEDGIDYDTVLYWDSDKAIISVNAESFLLSAEDTTVSANSNLYFESWSLAADDSSWLLSNDDTGYQKSLLFNTDGKDYTPVRFYADDANVYVLASHLSVASEFSVCIFTVHIDSGTVTILCLDESFRKFEITPVAYPMEFISVYPMPGGFLYNEGTRIFKIDAVTGDMSILFDENSVMNDIPLNDSDREFYSFFDMASYRDGFYILVNPAFNELSGRYVSFYNETLSYCGCILITENSIGLFSSSGERICEIDGEFYVYCYA